MTTKVKLPLKFKTQGIITNIKIGYKSGIKFATLDITIEGSKKVQAVTNNKKIVDRILTTKKNLMKTMRFEAFQGEIPRLTYIS